MTAPQRATVGVFYRSLPMVVADEHGLAEREGIAIAYEQVGSSTQQFESLRDGRYDCVQTSPDNVANYRLNASNPLGARIPAQAFLGLDYGMNLVLVAREGISSIAELRGRTLSVDAPESGFAYVLYALLRRHGLERDRDYEIVLRGGVAARYAALLEGAFDATLLSGGFETRAEERGFRVLGSVLDVADPYLGVVAAAREDWLDENAELARRLARAWLAGSEWVADPANRDAALELLARIPDTSPGLAERLYELTLRPGVGIVRDGAMDPAALANVLALRHASGGFDEAQDVEALARPGGGLVRAGF